MRFLRCTACHRRSTGWTGDLRPPRRTQNAKPERLALWRPPVHSCDVTAIDATDPVVRRMPAADLELASILADLDETEHGRRIH